MSPSNAHTERQVKAMNNIKTITRSRLSQCRMNNQFKVAMNSKRGDDFDPQPFVGHCVKLSSEAGDKKIILQCGQQVPNVFRMKSTYKPSVSRTKSKLALSEKIPKSISPLKTESITPKNTPTKHGLTALPASGSKRKSNLADGTPKRKHKGDTGTVPASPKPDALPAMLRAPLNIQIPENILSELTNLWLSEPPLLSIHNILFNHKDMHRLLTTTGQRAYLNDICVDFLVELLNRNQSTSFLFGSYLFAKYNGPDQKHAERYVSRQLFRFEDTKGAYNFPDFIFMPMCQGLHWTVLVVKPHTHKLIYLD